jgi:gliding motility-associated-like protein
MNNPKQLIVIEKNNWPLKARQFVILGVTMRKIRFLTIPVLLSLQIASLGQTVSCSDSSYRKYFYIQNDSLESVGKIDYTDGSQLILGRHKRLNEAFETGLLIRVDPVANILWSKDYVLSSGTEQFRLVRGISLSSGGYVAIGRITSFTDPLYNKQVILKIDQTGNLIWTKSLDLYPQVDINPLIQLQSICEGLNGDILVSGTVYTNLNAGFSGQGGLIMKISDAGDLIFSRMHLLMPGTVNDLVGVFVKDNQILLFGEVEDQACITDARGGIYSMTMDYNSGAILKTHRSCLSTPDNLNSYATYLHNFEVRQTKYGYALYGFLAESGVGGRDFLVESFDSQGDLTGGLTLTDHLIGKAYHNIAIDENGGIYLMGVSISKGLFGSVFTKEGNLLSQIKVDFPDFDKLYFVYEGGQKLSASANGFGNYINNSSVDNHSAITLINKFAASNFNSACLGVDTAFTTIVANNPATLSPFTVKQTINEAVVFSNLILTVRDNTVMKQELCSQVSHCMDLEIKGLDTICGNNNFLELTAVKSPNCFFNLNWMFDSTRMSQIVALSDSSIRLQLKPGTNALNQFEIRVATTGCNNLSASHIVNFLSSTNTKVPSDNTCEGDSIKLTLGNYFATYRWSNGATDSILFAKKEGQYVVEAGNEYCDLSDTFQVSAFRKIQLVDLGPDQDICEKDKLVLHAGSTFTSYLWQNGDNDSLIQVNSTGNYSLTVTDRCGVKSSDTIHVKINPCNSFFRMPSGFSPNADHINDVIKPAIQGKLEIYDFKIFNRWGQRVFESKNPASGWDGKINNALQQTGAYAWSCDYKFYNEQQLHSSGTFLLIR